MIEIRRCQEKEMALLAEIEDQADQIFPSGLIPPNAANYPIEHLKRANGHGSLIVASDDEQIVGFAVAEPRGQAYHLFLIAVWPQWGRQGIGGALLNQIGRDAIEKNLEKITLTTFSNIEWNAPYYKKKGFVTVFDFKSCPYLREILEAEAKEGFTNRVAMELVLWINSKQQT